MGVAAAGTTYPTIFTQFKLKSTSSERTFKGTITSSKSKCVKGRKVKLIRKHNVHTDKLGSDTTDGNGKFKVSKQRDQVKDGKYFAKVKSKDFDNGQKKCASATSGSIKISSG